MKPHEAVGYQLQSTTAITAITSTRIYHGLRPKETTTPCINFYEIGGGDRFQGFERISFSINCRAEQANDARALARLVLDEFEGTNGEGIYGDINGFEVSRASLRADNGLIPEPEDRLFNAPVDVTLIFPSSTVS